MDSESQPDPFKAENWAQTRVEPEKGSGFTALSAGLQCLQNRPQQQLPPPQQHLQQQQRHQPHLHKVNHLQRQPQNRHHPTQQAQGQQIQLKHQQQPKQLSQKLLIMEIAMIMVAVKNLFHCMVEEEKETYGIFEK